MKKRLLSLFVMMAMCLILFPASALASDEKDDAIYIQRIAYTGTPEAPCYLLTDENGNATTDGAGESNYNIKWDGTNLTLKDAYVVGASIILDENTDDYEGDVIRNGADVSNVVVTLIGSNKLVGISENSAGLAMYGDTSLTIGGEGSLVAEGDYSGIFAEKNGFLVTGGSITSTGRTGLYCNDITVSGGEIKIVGKAGLYCQGVANINGGNIYITSEQNDAFSCDALNMTGGNVNIDSKRFGICTLGEANIVGGTLNIQCVITGISVHGDDNLIIGGDAKVNVESNRVGIWVWTDAEEPSNCNLIFNGGTLNVNCGNEMFGIDGNIYIAPTAGTQAVVSVGEDASHLTTLDGAVFTEETIITDLIGECRYVSMSTVGAPVGNPYTDVQEDDWFYDAVVFASKSGLMTGTSATTFEPNTSFSRAMLVSVLHRLEGSPAAEGVTFTDVNEGDWYAEAVNWAVASGIVNGMEDGSFQPNAAVTREQMAAILCNYAQYKGIPTVSSGDLSGYSDADQVSEWAENAVAWAVDMGLIHGMSMNTLEPQGATTRAQAATVLMNAGSLLGGF